MNTNHYQIQVLNGLQLQQYVNNVLSSEEFNANQYYKGFNFFNKTQFNLHELQPIKNDKYIVLLDTNEHEHNIVGIVNLQNINKTYYYDSKIIFDNNNVNVKWVLDYIEIRKEYQNKGLIKLLLQGITTAVLPNEHFYITGFTQSGLQHHLNKIIQQELSNYTFYLITNDDKKLIKTFNKPILNLSEFNTRFS